MTIFILIKRTNNNMNNYNVGIPHQHRVTNFGRTFVKTPVALYTITLFQLTVFTQKYITFRDLAKINYSCNKSEMVIKSWVKHKIKGETLSLHFLGHTCP